MTIAARQRFWSSRLRASLRSSDETASADQVIRSLVPRCLEGPQAAVCVRVVRQRIGRQVVSSW